MMLVDCQTCPVRDVHCPECMVTALTTLPLPSRAAADSPVNGPVAAPDLAVGGDRPGASAPAGTVALDRLERRAVSVLIAAGLVGHDIANQARAVLEPAPTPGVDPVPRAM